METIILYIIYYRSYIITIHYLPIKFKKINSSYWKSSQPHDQLRNNVQMTFDTNS